MSNTLLHNSSHRTMCHNVRKSNLFIFSIALIFLCGVTSTHGFFGQWGPDLEGKWCATRPRGQDCCTGRNDVCGVPILGTECYCDIFCNETAYDCCPDYWSHCHGGANPLTMPSTTLPPPRSTRPPKVDCFFRGKFYNEGDSFRDLETCVKCICNPGGYMVCRAPVCLIRPELIRDLNDNRFKTNYNGFTWKASNYSKFYGKTLDEGIRYRLGTFLLPENVLQMTPLRIEDDVLPESFDSRERWKDLLHPISDQGDCGSSWAHSTTAVASDRLAIETSGAIKARLSPQNLLSCNSGKQEGCEGGHLDRAWWYLWKRGVVTEECYPYTSGNTNQAGKCLYKKGQKMCPSGIEYKTNTRYKATPAYRIRPLEREIMKEIMDNGPVQATMLVREDFFMYKHGIYSYSNLTDLRKEPDEYRRSGFQSVRIIGWGAEKNTHGYILKYWICANSWGSDWGEDGYFRILRGSDESRIERYVVGAWGKISGDRRLRRVLMENRRKRQRAERQRRQPRHLTTKNQRRRRTRRHNRRNRNRRHRHRAEQESKKPNYFSSYKPSSYNKMYKHKGGKVKKHSKKYSNFYDNTNLKDLRAYFPEYNH